MNEDDELHKLGEVLRTAREAKGVDLARVERDTKIRTRYLSALERGEYRELPGTVYTKGFLRNYGAYLGLDPEYLTDLYRLETNGTAERASPVPPRPMTIKRSRTLVVTPGAIAASILTVAVLAIVGYFVFELITFARTTALQITDPAGDVASFHDTSYRITGTSEPNATITVDGLRENPVVTADGQGHFSVVVKLVPGSNVISLVANDPVTRRDSAKETRTINVDLGGASPSPGSGVLVLLQPQDRATVTGPVRVAGTTTPGASVAITARLVTPATPGFTIMTQFGAKVTIPPQRAGLAVTPTARTGSDGAFVASMALAAGTWDVTVAPAGTASAASGSSAPSGSPSSASITRRVTVKLAPGLAGTLVVSGSRSYIVLVEDNVPVSGVSGHEIAPGTKVPLSARRTIVVRAGSAGSVRLTINGILLPAMGKPGAVIEWHITVR